VDPWQEQLAKGNVEAGWDLFIEVYRPLILKTIRHTITNRDESMEVFAHVCAALSTNNMARVNAFYLQSTHTAKFSTWLVVVVRNQAVDWLRKQTGRRRVRIPEQLSDLERLIFDHVFVSGCSHAEAYERIRAGPHPHLRFSAFLKSIAEVYRACDSGIAATRSRTPSAAAPLVDHNPLPDQLAAGDELKTHLSAALDILDPQDRLALQLFVVDDLGAAEVARLLGWPSAKTVYNRVYRGLAALRAKLEQEGITPTSV
jgi:RNA polymerase sigma factor (sigma-70 family)